QESLEAGKVCAFDLNNVHRFQFTQAVFYGYLRLIKEKAGSGNTVLRRDEKGMPVIDKEHDGDFLFDPTGGIFTHDLEIRQEYYKYRAALTMTLWDMAMRTKKRAIAQKMVGEFDDIKVYRYLLELCKGRDILKSKHIKLKKVFLDQVNDYCSRIVKGKKGRYAAYLVWGRILEMYADSQEKVEKKKKYKTIANERFKQAGKVNSRAWARHKIDLQELDELDLATLSKQDKNNVLYRLVSQY
ncbi:MAG: hypothetical protein GTO45_00455, partial [Candidatus Aminicenantes bacterium]|nr:hypothetical protein [Candidatus Aminicenantes bacterium]NIN21754.1 hypothetical protein [Candidatus Aminicenantes bacterium]NIN40392.1 hypothetical protein [Candidatus Aminicenantes bacterium]NIN83212.1 hypothetical protein [Candidatus Aminicenantes bacterium]NIO79012.1 hypothetical protein [Candidatus Aminicenantes bacterium]